ncbi:MAG TPA: SigF/SigG family RNA polymerase sporulation sigma factor [Candidatus Anaerostipes avistercoris]|uniref:RNA polymerase sigma factor n=1 Tax=Candidatus Anaerostipes avistercoris TaxID=2838462 RepID=A0A9D2TAF1_9FIRM|nr:SigF/SigG family RNA polymerase sporulation sigma factor [uncultured Anaerostipes sp.]HJC51241.1 SigF/SigG family RNA polymerase sporulation sigma factor [Candidatus Anaerostipes avistercoris]
MDKTRELLRLTKEGDEEAREKIVVDNMGLIWSVVKRFTNRGYDPEDLFQIGSIGLMKAVDKFDLSYDVKFSTYAVPMITGEIKRFLRDDGMIKVSRSLKENAYKIRQAMESFSMEHQREATLDELAQKMNLAREEIVVAMEANKDVESLHQPTYQGDGSEILLMDRIPREENEEERVLNHVILEESMKELAPEEKKLIEYRYFQGKTQQEIAGILHISQVQVSRLEKKILRRMREQMIGHSGKMC